jgi:flagellar export protein FliJ
MAQFTFKLESILRHRKNVEHDRQRALAIVQSKMTALEIELRRLDAEARTSNESVCRNHLVGRIDMNLLTAHRRYLAATQKRAMEIAQQMAVVQRQLDAARQALADAARDRRMLEKLRDHQQEAWRNEFNRRQMADQDEAAMQMSYRKGQSKP